MVRHYRPDPVDREAVKRIARAALRGPSAGDTQAVSVVVVTDPQTRAAIARLGDEEAWVAKGRQPWLSIAPVHLVLCVEPDAYYRHYAEQHKDPASLTVPWWWVDAGAALGLVLLAAVDQGLAAGFLGAHALPGLAEALELPAGVVPLGVVTVGHPAADRPLRPRRRRRPDTEALHSERWGEPLGGAAE
jgi:nitroreductase